MPKMTLPPTTTKWVVEPTNKEVVRNRFEVPQDQGYLLLTRLPKASLSSQSSSLSSGSPVSGPIAAVIEPIEWEQFHNYLLQRMTPKTAGDRMRYAKQYGFILAEANGSCLLQLSPIKRLHIMKALSNLARFTGRTEQWRQMLQQYQLSWSTGTEKLDAFTRFFDDSKDLDTMIRWLREAIRLLPTDYANFFLFCTLTGLRASECIEAVRLLNDPTAAVEYYDPEQQLLQHYKFPELFIRRTKAVYISVVNDQIIGIAKKIGKTQWLSDNLWTDLQLG